jgi:hypothetical protein
MSRCRGHSTNRRTGAAGGGNDPVTLPATAFERPLMRLIATVGVIAIGVVLAAIMTSQHSRGWLIGVVVSTVSVVLAGMLWSSRRL